DTCQLYVLVQITFLLLFACASFLSCTARIVVFFFFSSRRRHTRLVSDWSSDVCSSDLGDAGEDSVSLLPALVGKADRPLREAVRSEERRVGKEGRFRGGADH